MKKAEAHRRAHLQPPPGARLELAKRPVGVVEIRQNAAYAFEISPAGLCQVERAGGAIEQARAKLGLERADVPADRGFR